MSEASPSRAAPAVESVPARELAWVAAARAGDRDAFARLYESYAPLVHGVLLAHARSSEVRDLVHDVFLSALRGIARLDDPRRFGAWVCTIARNAARDDLKRRRVEIELVEEPSARAREGAGDAEEAERVLAVLRELPEAYRETLTLRLIEDLGGPEIAARTGLTPGSVRVNLCRGMKLLRERLESGRAPS